MTPTSALASRLGGNLSYNHVVPEPFFSDLKFVSVTLVWTTPFADATAAAGYSHVGS